MVGAPETPLQHDMFNDKLVDNRSRYQKRKDKTRKQPQQTNMFSLKETVQLGVSAKPWLKDLPASKLELESVDPRTAEEKELDLLREAQKMTHAMFAIAETPIVADGAGQSKEEIVAVPKKVCIAVFVQPKPIVGYRRKARYAKSGVRSRVAV